MKLKAHFRIYAYIPHASCLELAQCTVPYNVLPSPSCSLKIWNYCDYCEGDQNEICSVVMTYTSSLKNLPSTKVLCEATNAIWNWGFLVGLCKFVVIELVWCIDLEYLFMRPKPKSKLRFDSFILKEAHHYMWCRRAVHLFQWSTRKQFLHNIWTLIKTRVWPDEAIKESNQFAEEDSASRRGAQNRGNDTRGKLVGHVPKLPAIIRSPA
jgi:hypothetical protein